jgi:hypothetical protein
MRRVAAIAFSVLLTLALLETALRAAPRLLGGDLANAVYSVFRDWPLGINVRDPELRMNFMVAGSDTRAYWNGYWWRHRTDAWGFRNPADLTAKTLVLLGDSMVYGLGVEEEDTVAHFLRAEHGRAAYNMARQGDCLFQEYVLARLYLPRLEPESVVLFVFLNDFREIEANQQPIQDAAASVIERIDYDALRARVERPPDAVRLKDRLQRLHVWRLGRGAARKLASGVDTSDEGRQLTAAILEPARFAPIERYYRTVLADLARRCRERGSALALVLLEVPDEVIPRATAAQARVRDLLGEVAREQGLRFVATRDAFAGCSDCFLPGDGHLSREGHRRLAAVVASRIPPRARTGA